MIDLLYETGRRRVLAANISPVRRGVRVGHQQSGPAELARGRLAAPSVTGSSLANEPDVRLVLLFLRAEQKVSEHTAAISSRRPRGSASRPSTATGWLRWGGRSSPHSTARRRSSARCWSPRPRKTSISSAAGRGTRGSALYGGGHKIYVALDLVRAVLGLAAFGMWV